MAAPFTIDDFKAKVDGLGSFIRKNRYTVQIVPPSNMHVPVNIEFLVKQVSFPARTMGTTNFRYGGKFPARKYWHHWLELIQSTNNYNMNYYDDFKGTVKISAYDETDQEGVNPRHVVKLVDAWPKGISAIEMGWESNELIDFSVDIVYKKWEIET